MIKDKFYDVRDAMALDIAGGYYCRHVSAMTSEELDSKSDIAAELGWRDMQIAEIQRKVEVLTGENSALKSAGNKMFISAIGLMEDPDIEVDHDRDIKDWEAMKTPATDAALAEIRAQAIDEFGIYHNFSGKLMIQVEAKKYAEKLRKESGQ